MFGTDPMDRGASFLKEPLADGRDLPKRPRADQHDRQYGLLSRIRYRDAPSALNSDIARWTRDASGSVNGSRG